MARILHPVAGLLDVATGVREGRPTLSWRRNKEAIDRAARTDGIPES